MTGHLCIKVSEGRQMLPTGSLGLSADPFVKIRFNGKTHQGRTCKNTVNPRWDPGDNCWTFVHCSPTAKIFLEAYDWEAVGANNFMGMVVIDIKNPSDYFAVGKWFDLKPRPGDTSDEELFRKYGTFGQLKVDYSFTYLSVGKFIASDHLLGQLTGKIDGSTVQKIQHPEVDMDQLRLSLRRCAQHLERLHKPYSWFKDQVRGYRFVEIPDTKQYRAEVLYSKHRVFMYSALTMICLMNYIPIPLFTRFGRAALPALLLLLFKANRTTPTDSEPSHGIDISTSKLLFVESEASIEALFDIKQGYFAQQKQNLAETAAGTLLGTVDDLTPALLSKGMKSAGNILVGGIKTVGNTVSVVGKTVGHAVQTVSSPVLNPMLSTFTRRNKDSNKGGNEYEPPSQEMLQKSIDNSSDLIRQSSAKLESVASVIFWKDTVTAMYTTKIACLLFVALWILPTLPLGLSFWIASSYVFFVNRLYYTAPNLYAFINIGSIMMLISDCIETVVRVAFGGKFEFPTHHYKRSKDNTDVVVAAVPSSTADEPKKTCTVTLEVESPPEGSNKWETQQIPHCEIINQENDIITVDLGNGAPHFKIDKKFVEFDEAPTSNATSNKRTCTVTIEEEVPPANSNKWVTKTIPNCIIEKETNSEVTVNFGDGSPLFKVPKQFTDIGAGNDPKRTSLPFNVGDLVEVSYEKKSDEDWEMQQSVGTIVGCSSFAAEVDFGDGNPIYTAPLGTVKPHHARQSLVVGDLVDVTYEEEAACGTWMNKVEPARVHSIKNNGTVVVDWGDGDSLFCCNTKYIKKSTDPSKFQQKRASLPSSNTNDIIVGSNVLVAYEEEYEPDQWRVKRERATVVAKSQQNITVDWGDNDGTYETHIKHVTLIDDGSDSAPDANNTTTKETNGHNGHNGTTPVAISPTPITPISVGHLLRVEFEEEDNGGWKTSTDMGLLKEIKPDGTVIVDWLDGDEWYTTKECFVSTYDSSCFKVGQTVLVSFEKETPLGWTTTTDTATVVKEPVGSDSNLTVCWSDGTNDEYTCSHQFVAPFTFEAGDSVIVSYEKESSSGSWEICREPATVSVVKSDTATVRWEDSEETFTTPLKYMSRRGSC